MPTPTRQTCPGSCHCGFIRYIIYLTLPHPHSATNPPKPGDQEIYRCNCSTCHKMNMFHVHPANPRDDFFILSPLNPDKDLSTYQCFSRERQYFFCPRCGVRCFTISGEGEVVSIDDKGERRDAWHTKWDGRRETEPYIAVNGVTIEPREDFDWRVLTEEKRVQYFDGRSDVKDEKDARWDRPHYDGCY